MKMFVNSFGVIVAITTLTLIVSVRAEGLKKRKIAADCYPQVNSGGTNPITTSLVKGVTNCSDARNQIGKTALFGGTPHERTVCPGSLQFCCAVRNIATSQIVEVYCQNLP